MSCFFCQSINHLSQYCDVYPSDESRKQYLQSKNLCSNCLTGYYGSFLSYIFGHSCQTRNIKCHFCFARHHHTVYCPKRFTVSSSVIFLPNIDRDLFQRYRKCLNLEEQNLLALSSPEAFNAIIPKKLMIRDIFNNFRNKKFDDCILIVNHEIFLGNVTSHPSLFKIICKAPSVSVIDSSLAAEEFLHLLSSKTRAIFCSNVRLTPHLQFKEIIKKAPNIKNINFWSIDVTFEYSWPSDFIKWKAGDSFESLKLTIDNVNFDVEALAQFIKTNSTYAEYYLYIEVSPYDASYFNYKKEHQVFFDKLSKYFFKTKRVTNNRPILRVVTPNTDARYTCLQIFLA